MSSHHSRTRLSLLVTVATSLVCAVGFAANSFRNISDVPFASVANGPQGAIVIAQPPAGTVSSATVHSAVATQHALSYLQRAQTTLALMKRHGLVRQDAEVRFPRTIVHTEGNRLVLPDLGTAMVHGQQLGNATNSLTFVFQGFSSQDEAELRSYLDVAVPKARLIYGAPAFSITVKIIQDGTLDNLQGGTYDVTTNEIRIPPLSGNFPEDTYVLLMLVLNAFHDDAMLFYDAWEQGFIGAAAYAIQTTPGVLPGYDPIDPGPFYCLSIYEAENHPELANSTYYPASGATNMLVWRIAMARAAWLKCYIEDDRFFANFNRAYYDNFGEGLPGNVPALKMLAAGVLPQVEGQSFFDWFNGQYVLDTSVHLGPKLYVWNIPLEISVALIAELYNTLPGGDEQPFGGTARTTYWSYDFAVKLYAEEGNIMDIPSGGTSVGEGFLLPTFFNIGGAQRITVDVETGDMFRQYPYPYQERGFGAGENNLYGAIIGSAEGTIDVIGGNGLSGVGVRRGVWGDRITSSSLSPQQLEISFQNKLGQTVTRKYNVGWDSYITFINGADQTRVTHTFLKGTTGLQMISLPVTPIINSAPDILGIDSSRLLMAEWDATLEGADKYRIWPNVRPFTPGRGFWLKLFEDVSIQVFGILPNADERTRVYLPIGWNIIGSPRLSAINTSEIRVQFGEQDSVPFADAVNNGWVQQGIFEYDQQAGYDTVEQMQPFAGHWMRVLRSPGVYVDFPVATTQSVSTTASRKDPLTWKLPLTVRAGGLASCAAYLGVAPEATGGPDPAFDISVPPDFGPYVKVRFTQPRDAAAGASYLTDVRPEVWPQRWNLQVSSSLPDTEVALSWPDLSGLPLDVRPILVDRDTGRTQYMRTTAEFSFRTGPDGGLRRLAVEIAGNSADLLTVSSLSAAQTGGGVAIAYTLSRPAGVSIRVMNIAGRTVAVVASDQASTTGTNNAVWNMRNSAGAPVPAGTYLLQITACAEDGQQVRRLQPVQLQR